MRRNVGFVLLGLAVFSLAFAALLRFYAPSQALKTPLDLKLTLYGDGRGMAFDSAANKAVPVTFRSIRNVAVDSNTSTDDVVVAQQFLCILINSPGAKNCVRATNPKLLPITDEIIAADRKTAVAVKGFGSELDGNPVDHVGLTLKFPFDAAKKTYGFWDYNLEKARPATFVGETKLDSSSKLGGLTLYKYEVLTPETKADVVPGIAGLYSDTRTLYVEPQTGTIVKADDHQIKKFANGTLALDLTISTAAESIDLQAQKAQDGKDEIRLLTVWLPLALVLAGLVLLGLAVFALRGSDNSDPGRATAVREPAHAQ